MDEDVMRVSDPCEKAGASTRLYVKVRTHALSRDSSEEFDWGIFDADVVGLCSRRFFHTVR